MACGAVILIGYILGWQKSSSPYATPFAALPLAAVVLVAGGLAAFSLRPIRMGRLSLFFTGTVALAGLFRIAGAIAAYVGARDSISHFLISLGWVDSAGRPASIRLMSAVTALLIAEALLLFNARRPAASQTAAALGMAPPLVILAIWFFGGPTLGILQLVLVVGGLACAAAILFRSAHRAPLKELLSPGLMGRRARIQTYAAVGICLFVGLLVTRFHVNLDFEFVAVLTLVVLSLVVALIALDTHMHHRIDRKRRRAESKALAVAQTDALTGLMNRQSFLDAGERAILDHARRGQEAGVLLIDIDQFRAMNDSAGHAAGDEVLRRVGAVVASKVNSTVLASRLGGDEFALVLPACNAAECMSLAEDLRTTIAAIDMRDILFGIDRITVSIGADVARTDRVVLRNILFRAESALHRAKPAGGNRCFFYELDLPAGAEETSGLEHDLRGAWERGEIFLLYQPQVDLATRRLCGVEALARWNHPLHGLIAPQRFVSLAEDTGLIRPMGAWILSKACREAQSWQNPRLREVAISVNASALQLEQLIFIDVAKGALRRSGLEPHRLVLEVTETAMVTGDGRAVEVLQELRKLGVRVAIDDFGLGYSSLSYLRRLPSDFLKIDRSFVSDLPHNTEAVAIARAIIGIGRSLNMRIIAEGIETPEQAELLQSIWCDEGQGYLYGKPMSSSELESWATERDLAIDWQNSQEAAALGGAHAGA